MAKKIVPVSAETLLISVILYNHLFPDTRSLLNVDRDRLILNTILKGSFQEFVDISGTIQPIRTVYLNAIEGGVEQEFKCCARAHLNEYFF